MEVQTRSEETGLKFFSSVSEAFLHARADRSVWKISFTDDAGSRVRLVTQDRGFSWIYEPLDETSDGQRF